MNKIFRIGRPAAAIIMLLLVISALPLFGAGTRETEAREMQFDDPYKALDLPLTAGPSLRYAMFSHTFDFTEQAKLDYSYTEMVSSSETDPASGTARELIEQTDAGMQLRQSGLSFADVIYSDIVRDSETAISDGASNETVRFTAKEKPGTINHSGFTQKGDYPYDSTLDFTYDLQFPLLDEDFLSGDTVTIPLSMPVKYLGGEVAAFGTMELHHTGYIEINGQLHAKLLGRIVITDESLPAAVTTGEFSLLSEGYGVYYFNVEEHAYYYGSFRLQTTIQAASLLPVLSKFSPAEAEGNRVIEHTMQVTYQLK